jgi:hypothetical protein
MSDFVHSLLQYEKMKGLFKGGRRAGIIPMLWRVQKFNLLYNINYTKSIDTDRIWFTQHLKEPAGGIMEKAGYEHKTSKGGGFADTWVKGYVPFPNPEGKFGGHQMVQV